MEATQERNQAGLKKCESRERRGDTDKDFPQLVPGMSSPSWKQSGKEKMLFSGMCSPHVNIRLV